MGYSIVTWVTKGLITLTKLTQISTNIDVLRGYAGIARRVANQDINDSSLTPIEWDHVYLDEDTYFAIATDATKITLMKKGRYSFNIGVDFEANVTGIRGVALYKNGVLDEEYDINALNSALKTSQVKWVFETAQRNAGDYYQIKGYQNSGGTLIMQARVSVRRLLDET